MIELIAFFFVKNTTFLYAQAFAIPKAVKVFPVLTSIAK